MITGTLENVKLSEANPFYALSYVWGDASRHSTTITVNGQTTLVRLNLWNFLRRLRSGSKFDYKDWTRSGNHLRVWVHAICINQQDSDERSAQVLLIGDIFKQADCVLCWLGMPGADPTAAIKYLRRPRRPTRSWPRWWERWFSQSSDAVISKKVDAGLRELFQSTYWQRLLVIQEVCLAKDLILFCGPAVMTWADIKELVVRMRRSNTLYFVLKHHSDDPQHQSSFDTARLYSVEDARERLEPQPLSRVVFRFKGSQCQDSRDKIYGVLSLASEDSVALSRSITPRQCFECLSSLTICGQNHTANQWKARGFRTQSCLTSLSCSRNMMRKHFCKIRTNLQM